VHRRRAPALLLVLVIPAFFASVPFASAVTRGDLEASRARAAATRKAQAAAQSRAARLLDESRALQSTVDRTEGRIADIRSRMAAARTRRSRIESDMAAVRVEVSEKESLIATAQASYTRQSRLLSARVDAAYRQGDLYYLELVLGSRSINDLIARTVFVQEILRDNERSTAELLRTRVELQAAKTALDRSLADLTAMRTRAAEEENRLRSLQAGHAATLREQQVAQGRKASLLGETKANIERLKAAAEAEEAEAASIAAELRGGGSSSGGGRLGGSMTWPTPGFGTVTSDFGWRTHPILGVRKFHQGIDVSAPSGARIVAVAAGTVLFSGDRGGYGNVVMIDHGDGLVTVYAHQSSIAVSEGKRVTRGQTVGRVGSTGLSTGPHLHFEARVNGSARDPMGYL
jgi:murein DD-endopeptidase MepM/ murein hydrolase activator NlpD